MSLPVLNPQFFAQHHPNKEFWMKWGTTSEWSATLCPLYEWENVLYVGASQTEDPGTPRLSQPKKIILIHCEPSLLQLYFQNLRSLVNQAKIPTAHILKPKSSAEGGAMSASGDQAPAPSARGDDGDPFASLATGLINLKELEPQIAAEAHEPGAHEDHSSAQNPPEEEEVLEGLSLNSPPPPPLRLTKTADGALAQMPVPEMTQSVIQAGIGTGAGAGAGAGVAKPENFLPEDLSSVPHSSQLDKSAKTDAIAHHVLEEMQSHFAKSMILKREGNALVPWFWDEKFNGQENTGRTPLSLGRPSPFRIVARTLKPYHGYVVPNEVSEKFFEEWNSSEIPAHLTLTPVVVADRLMAVLMGMAGPEVNQKASLQLAEKLSLELEALEELQIKQKAS